MGEDWVEDLDGGTWEDEVGSSMSEDLYFLDPTYSSMVLGIVRSLRLTICP
jgi:hypothetical protein